MTIAALSNKNYYICKLCSMNGAPTKTYYADLKAEVHPIRA